MREFYCDEKRIRPRKKHHRFFSFVLMAALLVLCLKGIPQILTEIQNREDPVPAACGGTGESALSLRESDTLPKETAMALKAMEKTDPRAGIIAKHPGHYPERLLESLGRNPELLPFTLDYPKKKGTYSRHVDLSGRCRKGRVPLLMQWDEDWGYARYGDGIIALDGCGPTCLSMVVIGLTGDLSKNPRAVAEFSEQCGYLDRTNNSTRWTLMSEGARQLGLDSREIPLSESGMVRELSEGHPIICCMGPGDFTTQGHFIVLDRFRNGGFSVRDPNSRERSGKTWSYQVLKPQIRDLWAFSSR